MLKIVYGACPCLSQLVSAQFVSKMCLAARHRQKNYFNVQGHSRLLNLMAIESQCTTFY